MAELPQHSGDQDARQDAIDTKADEYNFQDRGAMGMKMLAPTNAGQIAGPPGSVDFDNLPLLPEREVPSQQWFGTNIGAAALGGVLNGGLITIAKNMFFNQLDLPFDNRSHVQKLNDFYGTYVRQMPRPDAADVWHTDNAFCLQRICGVNPVKIRRVTNIALVDGPGECSIEEEHFDEVLGPTMSLQQAIDDGLVYVCDYAELAAVSGAIAGPLGSTKYLSTPIAVFFWREATTPGERDQLIPVAIQIVRGSGQSVFRPSDTTTWQFAKAVVQTADAVVHELDTHLIRAHAAMEPFPVSAERTMSEEHPLLQLLRPHFEAFLQINSIIGLLTDEEMIIDYLFPVTHEDKLVAASTLYGAWSFWHKANPHQEIASRGMDAASCPVNYPYRDDGLEIWDAVETFVTAYINHWYSGDADVGNDYELQAFMRDLVNEGGVTHLLEPNADGSERLPADIADPQTSATVISTVDELIVFITTIIWTAGPYHSAVNYPQYEQIGWVPNMPFSGYLPPPPDPNTPPPLPGPLSTLEDYYPPDIAARLQVLVMHALSFQRFDQLGHYPADTFDDDGEVWKLVADFQCELAKKEVVISARNVDRPMDYPYFLPHNITNSTSI